MSRGRRFWITLIAWLLLGVPTLVGIAWFRPDGLPIPDPPRFERGVMEVIGWVGIIGLVYLTPIFLIIDEVQFRRSQQAEFEKKNAQD